jgi:hypothetical protein
MLHTITVVVGRSLCSVLSLTILMTATARAQERPDFSEMLKVAAAAAPLKADERALAIRLAEETLRASKLLPDKKTFLTEAKTHRNTEAEQKGLFERHALLTYYKYAGDLGILVYINLVRQRVIKVDKLPHFPAGIAPEELQRAREMVLNDPQLGPLLNPYGNRLTVEALLTSNPQPKDSRFGHRLFYLIFRVGPRYLTAQGEVLADLTTETVMVSPAVQPPTHGSKH